MNTIVDPAQDTSPLPYSPLEHAEVTARRRDALDELGFLALVSVENADGHLILDAEGPGRVATYREWCRASVARSRRQKAGVSA